MKILSMKISGKMAHFRKYYANNTALSYFLPPRTTIMGMLAAIMGFKRDEYYEQLSSEKIRIGVGIGQPIKKSFHRLNLLKIKGKSDFRGREGRVQTPFEVVTGYDIKNNSVSYNIYIGYYPGMETIFNNLCNHLKNKNPIFALSLGPANMSGFISDYRIISQDEIHVVQVQDTPVLLHTAVNTDHVEALNWENNRKLMVEEELMPIDFEANYDRALKKMQRVLYTTDGQGLPVTYSGTYWELKADIPRRITFLE